MQIVRRSRIPIAVCLRALSTSAPSSTERFILHGFEHSQPVRSVLLFLQENDIKFDFVELNPVKGETKTPEYKKINPTGLVPCLVHQRPGEEDFSLGEASAIMQYLCGLSECGPVGGSALLPKPLGQFYPSAVSVEGARERAAVDFWLAWHHHNTRICTLKVFHPFVFRKMYAKFPGGHETPLNEGLKSITRSLSFMDAHFARTGHRFLTNSKHATIADMLLIPDIDQLLPEAYGIVPTIPQDYPHVAKWLARCADSSRGGLASYAKNYSVVAEAGQQYQQRQRDRATA